MVDTVRQPIVVTTAQGVTDLLQASISYVVIITTFFSGLVAMIGAHKTVEAVAYVQANLGPVVTAIFSLGGVALMVWRLYKTYKRGAQLASIAADRDVPDHVAQISK
jgi:energy-converting hydrogenase Eha subunit C